MTNQEVIKVLSQHSEHWKRLLTENICSKEEASQTVGALEMAIKALEQEPKTGHWISHYDEDEKVGWYECDRCHTERAFNTKFCPDCGAKMVTPQESEG